MDARDLKDLKDASMEIYSTFFSTNIEFRYLVSESDNIYSELKHKQYSDPIILTGRVDLNPMPEDIRADIGTTTKSIALFEIPTINLEEEGMMEKTKREIKSGVITFNGVVYDILNFIPVTNVDEIFIFHKFEASGRDE